MNVAAAAAAVEAAITPKRRGRRRTAERVGLPPGMIERVRNSGTYYYLARKRGRSREELPLGGSLEHALDEYAKITGEPRERVRNVAARPWLAADLHAACKKRAKVRGLAFALTVQDVEQLLADSRGRCALTGIGFDLRRRDGERRRKWAPSIDRIENSAGYTPANVRLVCSSVNIALNDFGEELLVKIARALLRKRRARL